jgi:hypothetical protein
MCRAKLKLTSSGNDRMDLRVNLRVRAWPLEIEDSAELLISLQLWQRTIDQQGGERGG